MNRNRKSHDDRPLIRTGQGDGERAYYEADFAKLTISWPDVLYFIVLAVIAAAFLAVMWCAGK